MKHLRPKKKVSKRALGQDKSTEPPKGIAVFGGGENKDWGAKVEGDDKEPSWGG